MIDLNRSKEQMLAEIDASADASCDPLDDPSDPRFALLDETRLVVQGKTPNDLLSTLNAALARRFDHVSSEHLFFDLLYPLKKAVGNGYKWGNRQDPEKKITVEVVTTPTGAVVAVTDEGEGFDYRDVLARFQSDKEYFTNGGSGFKQFKKTKSVTSYADNGRTVLIRFLSVQEPGRPLTPADHSLFREAGDATFMKEALAERLPEVQHNGVELEDCRVFVPHKQKPGQLEINYLLKCRDGRTGKVWNKVLAGRLLPEAIARYDFEVICQLHELSSNDKAGASVPAPVALLEQPSLALFEFNPAGDFRNYLKFLKKKGEFQDVLAAIKKVASGLSALHRSRISVENDEGLEEALQRFQAAKQSVIDTFLQTAMPQRAERVENAFLRFWERAAMLRPYDPVPIHGNFGWQAVLQSENRLYFYYFDESRLSHPGLDVGGFLADLLEYYVLDKDGLEDRYLAGREAFLEEYFAGSEPAWRDDLPFFLAGALLLRLKRLLQRPQKKWASEVDSFLEYWARLVYELVAGR